MNKITFCKNRCCPVVEFDEDIVILGDKDGVEGITKWTRNQFSDFVIAAKNGLFDNLIEEKEV
jgi:hypothetical protein